MLGGKETICVVDHPNIDFAIWVWLNCSRSLSQSSYYFMIDIKFSATNEMSETVARLRWQVCQKKLQTYVSGVIHGVVAH